MKLCTKCNKEKPLTEFNRDRSRKDGYRSSCRSCSKQSKEYQQKYYLKNKNEILEKTKEYRKKHPGWYKQQKRIQLLYKYNLTLEDYDFMFEGQNGICAICGEPETEISRYGTLSRLCVDHDHKTNRVRGLLCRRCNRVLGNINDNTAILQSAIDYLGD